jgi:hypothetical protein
LDGQIARGNVFLILMVIGLVGLVALAIPAFSHSHGALSGHGLRGGGHALGSGAHATSTPAVGSARGALQQLIPADAQHDRLGSYLPSPRAVFSVLTLYGAFGNAGTHAFHLSQLAAAFLAVVPALLVEVLVVRRVWNLLFRFQGAPSSPLEQLILTEAEAVVPFRNGRGLISTVKDGRRVQLAARLRADQETEPVKVGTRLLIEDVDAARERVTVAIIRE